MTALYSTTDPMYAFCNVHNSPSQITKQTARRGQKGVIEEERINSTPLYATSYMHTLARWVVKRRSSNEIASNNGAALFGFVLLRVRDHGIPRVDGDCVQGWK